MSDALHQAILKVSEAAWQAYGNADAREIRECAEVSFVPGEKSKHKDTQPLRYVAIRIRQRQKALFEDGSKVKHFAVVTNIGEWKAGRLIEWHREKAGTVEGVHDVVKNELAGGVMPSKYFGANAAWLRLAVIAHNVLTALKRLALPAEMLTARPKRLRFLVFRGGWCITLGNWSCGWQRVRNESSIGWRRRVCYQSGPEANWRIFQHTNGLSTD